MKNHQYNRLFQISLAVLALGAAGLLVYQNTGEPAKLATAPALKSRSDLRNLAMKTPHASKPQGILPDAATPVVSQEAPPSLMTHHLFQEFNDWAVQYAKATPVEQQQMLAKGETMVKERHERMARLIEKSPRVALDESDALSPLAREALPEELKAQLEQPVNARGDLTVRAYYGKDVTPYQRFATLDQQEYTVYPAGNNETILSESNRSLLGIKLAVNRTTTAEDGKQYPRVDRVIALRKDRVRILSTEEVAVASKALENGAAPICEVSEKSVTATKTPAAIETGGDTKWLCQPSHATAWLESPEGTKLASIPAGAAAAGDPSTGAGGYWPLPENWATGNKTYLCVRFLCQDQVTSNFTNAETVVPAMLEQINRWSGGRIQFSPPTIAPTIMRLPRTVAQYQSGQYNAMNDAKAMTAAAYNLNNYSFYSCCIQGVYIGNGFADMGGKSSMIGTSEMHYFQHELGHNLGLPHLNLWQPTTSDPIGAGTHQEYLGSYDMMSDLFGTFNTMSRFYLRWLKVDEIHDLGFRTEGTYTIYDPDVTSLTLGRKYSISIPRSDGSFYFVEFRPRVRKLVDDGTVDPATVNGLRILRTRGAEQIDLKPLSTGVRPYGRPYDGTLLVGEEFYDAAEGIRVKAIAKGGSAPDQYFQVQVSYTNSSVISGHNYMIRAKEGNFMVGVTNYSGDNGGQIAQQNWEGYPNQKWMLMETAQNSDVYKIVNMNSGKVLEVGGYSVVNGGTIQQWDYVGISSQKWQIVATSGGYFKLINSGSGLALTVPYPLTQTGLQLQQYTYQGSVNQQWAFDEVNPLDSGLNYRITARNSEKAMDVSGSSYADATAIYQWTVVNDSPFQKWTTSTQGGAMQAFMNVATGKALQVGSTNPAVKYGMLNGDLITQKSWTGDAWQKWTLVAVDSDAGGYWYKIVNVGSGLAADVSNADTGNGAAIQQYSYWGGQNQQWRFTRVP